MVLEHLNIIYIKGMYVMGRRLTTDEFVRRAQEIHGNKYDYNKAGYVNMKTKLTIICKTHGEFKQTPLNHLNGSGCYHCYNASRTYGTKKFIELATKVHGKKYKYDKTKYTGSNNAVIVLCPNHGYFKQRASSHLSGHGCKLCM